MRVGGKNIKLNKKLKQNTKDEFLDCESDTDRKYAPVSRKRDLSLVKQCLADPNAFRKELKVLVATTEQLLCKFDSVVKRPRNKCHGKLERSQSTDSESDPSSHPNSMSLNIQLQVIPQLQTSTHQAMQPSSQINQIDYDCQQCLINVMKSSNGIGRTCISGNTARTTEAGENQKQLCNVKSNTSKKDSLHKSVFLTPKTSSSYIFLPSKHLNLHTNSPKENFTHKLQQTASQKQSQLLQTQPQIILEEKTCKPTKESIQLKDFTINEIRDHPSIISLAGGTLRNAGINILSQGRRLMSSISEYMGGNNIKKNSENVNTNTKTNCLSQTSFVTVTSGPTQSLTTNEKNKLNTERATPINEPAINTEPQFPIMSPIMLPPQFAAYLGADFANIQHGTIIPAMIILMPTQQYAQTSTNMQTAQQQDNQPLPVHLEFPHVCVPMQPPDHISKITSSADLCNNKINTAPISDYSTSEMNCKCGMSLNNELHTPESNVISQNIEMNTDLNNPSFTFLQSTTSFPKCPIQSESLMCINNLKDCMEIQLKEEIGPTDFETISEVPMGISESASEITLVPLPLEQEQAIKCCGKNTKDNAVKCTNLTFEELINKTTSSKFGKKYVKPCSCGLKYPQSYKGKIHCDCKANGQFDEDCTLPSCLDKYGTCPCDCNTKESVVRCCMEAETCICTDYSSKKLFRLALPQHKDLNLCIKCRFHPSPLIDEEGKVICPGNCGCCLCPWQTRPSLSNQNLLLHEKVRICECRDRGTIFNLSPKNSKCNNTGRSDLCPCRERAEAKFLELFQQEMFKIGANELFYLSGAPITLDDVSEIIPLKQKRTQDQKLKT